MKGQEKLIIVKIHWLHLKLSCRTPRLVSIELGTKHPWEKEIQASVFLKEGSLCFPKEDTFILQDNFIIQNQWANFNQTWHKAFFGEGNSS